MNLPYNPASPSIMHIDINSCFATLEQQANPLLRHRPVVVAAYTTDYGCVLAASREAKKFGIKTGTRVGEAKKVCPKLVVLNSNPNLYRDAHTRFINTLTKFTPYVYPKSIDEAILDFSWQKPNSLLQVALQIKSAISQNVGEWVTVSIGIGTNRFWAKTGANLIKPDGLVLMNSQSADRIYSQMTLLDIHGINIRNEARLKKAGIFTPIQFAHTNLQKLTHEVFQSQAQGHHWYLRLRGYETDQVEFSTKSIGHSYVLQQKTSEIHKLEYLFLKLSEKTGTRLRRKQLQASGVYLALSYLNKTYAHHSHKLHSPIYSSWEIFQQVKLLLHKLHTNETVQHIAMGVFQLSSIFPKQKPLFFEIEKQNNLAQALDTINNRYGAFTIHPATMLGHNGTILDRIAFGKIKDIQYQDLTD